MSEVADLAVYFADASRTPRFTRRPAGIPGDLRLSWRLSVLCLILQRGRGSALRPEHLHVLWWAIRSLSTREQLLRWFAENRDPDELLVRFDPALTATLDLALGAGLASRQPSGTIKLTVSGTALVQALRTDPDALQTERQFLDRLPNSLTQTQLKTLLEWR